VVATGERREVVHTRETFGELFPRWLTRRKPYLEDGSWACYERDGRIRLLLGARREVVDRLVRASRLWWR
jgi:hypothetical protein